MFGRTGEACGDDDVASGYEFFKRAFRKNMLEQLRIITVLARSCHRKGVDGSWDSGLIWCSRKEGISMAAGGIGRRINTLILCGEQDRKAALWRRRTATLGVEVGIERIGKVE